MSQDLTRYGELLTQIKDCIRRAQVKATLSANAEMILMYWDISRMIHERQQHEGWGAKVIPQLSRDIRNELPEIKGFSERNLKRMIAFRCKNPMGTPHPAHGKDKKLSCPALVHAPDHRTGMEPECAGADD
jgi:hypothetical protein